MCPNSTLSSDPIPLTAEQARRIAVRAQVLDGSATEALFGFHYRLEMYVPRDQRQYGYFVLPALHGDRLIGRVDPELDRKERVLRVHSLYLEPEAPDGAKALIEGALHELAGWLGARDVALAWLMAAAHPAWHDEHTASLF